MAKCHWQTVLATGAVVMVLATSLSACSTNVVYKRAIGDLNQKAQEMMAVGNVQGALCRLESARDLDPTEPITLQNLAVAYHGVGAYDAAIAAYKDLLKLGTEEDKAALYKSLGIAYEARADEMAGQATADDEAAEDSGAPAATAPMDKGMLLAHAIEHYEMAIDSYQQAIDLGVPEAEAMTQQITLLEKRLNDLKTNPSEP